MLTKTNKEKCTFQRNDRKPRNIKDTKNTLKAFREEADQVQRKTFRLASYIFTEACMLCHPLSHLRPLNPARLGLCTVTYSWVRTEFSDLEPIKHGRSDRFLSRLSPKKSCSFCSAHASHHPAQSQSSGRRFVSCRSESFSNPNL